MEKQRSRRRFLRRTLPGTLGVSLLAGCSGSKGTDTTTSTDADSSKGTTTTSDSGSEDAGGGTRTVTDAAGRDVTVPASVERVVGLGPGALRFITYLGATDRVVGVERLETKNEKRPFRPYVLARPELQELPSVGSRKSPDPELLLERDPDLVVRAYASAKKADGLQNKLDTPVVSINPGDLNDALRPDFYDSLRLVGEVLNEKKRADELVSYTKETISDLNGRTAGVSNPPKTYVGYLGRGKHGLLYTQPEYPPFSFVGTNNVARDVTDGLKKKKGAPRVTIDAEQLIKWDPEYVFVDLGTESYDDLSKSEYESIAAVEEGNVFGVFPTRDYSINFGTALADAYAVGTACFPDQFGDIDPAKKADAIYERFVGEPVYDEAAAAYGNGFGRMNGGQ
ncbi:ABC transporter substrate-binding protein [Haladaptatus sp. T7]|uniref:ABC transporter substrate-binding protein n=1 Tax=Haladaptatus sp. T7 TaxID=2029368 RepID=UPI0021A254FA|nr:ABC transporter substrate-binding protein [Haladaptatus sp. T7]GKZ15684.1 iron ABC transporter substrate-binding protein [Haladaptatus sp. T7]